MSSVSKNPPRHKTVHNIWRDGWQELRIRNIATMLGRRARDWQEPWTQPSSPGDTESFRRPPECNPYSGPALPVAVQFSANLIRAGVDQ
jgi:hypothetical protein